MIVIDASVGGKWLLKIDEAYRDKALELLKRHSNDEEKIAVPDLFFYEISNAIVTKTTVSPSNLSQLIKRLYEVNLSIYHPNEGDVIDSAKLSNKYNTTVYDMIYAVLAKNNKTTLVTADDRFIQKTGFMFVKHLKYL